MKLTIGENKTVNLNFHRRHLVISIKCIARFFGKVSKTIRSDEFSATFFYGLLNCHQCANKTVNNLLYVKIYFLFYSECRNDFHFKMRVLVTSNKK